MAKSETNPQPAEESPWFAPRTVAKEILLRIKAHPIRNVSILTLLAISVVGLAIGLMYLSPPVTSRPSTAALLKAALNALDQDKLPLARQFGADLRLRTDVPAKELGVSAYVLGVVMHQDAVDEWHERERRAYFLMAARYLDESRRAGFPAGRQGHGSYLLGKSFQGCERLADSLPHLQVALETYPARTSDICRMLAHGYLNGKTPDLKKAADFNQRYLADPKLSREDRDAALLTQARITFELGQYDECSRQLDQFTQNSVGYPEAKLLQGRIIFATGNALAADPAKKGEAAEKYNQARQIFAEAYDVAARSNPIMRQAQYLQGLCLRRVGDFLAAEGILARNRRSHFEAPEGLASGIEEAELQHLLGNDTESLASYRRVLRQIADTPNHVMPWISDEELHSRLNAAVADYRQESQFESAADLLQAISLVFPGAETVESQATLHQQWGEYLSKQAVDLSTPDPVAVRTRSRLEHRQAGVDFGRLAKLRFSTREYPSDLWRSAENYLLGQDYDSAAKVYHLHLDSQGREGRPPALTRLGECLLALNRPEEALQYVNECIEFFPKDPFVYRARITAAAAELEMEREKQAEELLITNLETGSLTPQSREWRDSLYALGRIHYLNGSRHETASRQKGIDSDIPAEQQAGMKELELAHAAFRECVGRLSEAVQREPQAEQSIEARYMLAMAHALSAKLPKRQLAGVNIEATRVAFRREYQRELTAAIAEFDSLKALLIEKEQRVLSAVESGILRNCYFGKADALFDLEQYEEAIQAYSSATNRYQQEPESLEAFTQISICQRKLGRLTDSKRTLQQAEAVLLRMPQNAVFERTTRYNRQEWSDLLGWLGSLQ